MSRGNQRKRGAQGLPDPPNLTLRDLRFDSAESSELFFNLRYVNNAFRGVSDEAIMLPPVDESISTTPNSGGMVYKAFPHGLLYGDQMSLMGGMGLFIGALVILYVTVPGMIGGTPFVEMLGRVFLLDALFVVFGVFILPIIILAFLGDLIGYRFNTAILFNRNAGLVHVFSNHSFSLRFWKSDIRTYDWRCIRAEVDTMRTLSNINSRKEAGLRCLVYDRPGGDTVIDQFVLGINMPAHCVQPLLDTWEHVRRFMQHEGPLFADETDKPNPSLGRQSLWRSLSDPVVFEIKSTIDMFKLGWEEKSLLILFMSMLSVALIPIIWIRMLFGLFPWLSGLFKREPKWPAEILASVGGRALSGRELAAMHHVLPFEADAVPAVDAGGTGVSDQEDR